MTDNKPFLDYYRILQVDPTCSQRTLETAYRHLAKTYHPDHPDGGDVARLAEVIEAYRALKDHDDRVQYDLHYASVTGFAFTNYDEQFADEKSTINDAEVQKKLLFYLYKKRREDAREPGSGRYHVQQTLNCSDEHFEFHLWYLREKGLIETTEQGTLAITVEGVDHVISMSRSTVGERLRISQSTNPQDQTDS